jgi:hypothetical protein
VPRPKPLIPQMINREQMRQITANLLHDGMKERAGLNHIRISIRAVREAGPAQFIPCTQAEFVPDNKRTLDYYAVPGYDLYLIEGVYDTPKFDPTEKLTRAEFLVDLLDRLEGFGQSLKYSPALYERVSEELEIAQHYIRGAYDLAELADISYLEKEEVDAPAQL